MTPTFQTLQKHWHMGILVWGGLILRSWHIAQREDPEFESRPQYYDSPFHLREKKVSNIG
ncbi:hypothetical protein TanjilG_10148 [Lupinus angustifolius]|uniref:Uncharacterized protein n=1 Tax=Lupinus angustifolius TaxID=3871 RepID=A0A1J7H2S2_LUPAN|nr:hypothetical protein TanjilG_10148 [Lupinus angustifolius]